MKRNIAATRTEKWQEVVSDVEENEDEEEEKGDVEMAKVGADILQGSEVMSDARTGSSILITLGAWGVGVISLLGVTPTSKQAQTIYMAFMLVLSLVPILALVIQNGTSLNEVLFMQEDLVEVEKSVIVRPTTIYHHILPVAKKWHVQVFRLRKEVCHP